MTDIHLYNTRTRSKESFEPIDPNNVRMYVCGPTVYDRAHIGNARPVVVFDVMYRLLRHVYGEKSVTYARNFTDVDDRIIARAVETKGTGETLEAATRRITDETIGWYHEDMDALGVLRPDHEPRCTEMIPEMVTMTKTLIDQGHAYEAEGHVLFAVETYDRYGKLAGRSLDDMIAGSRVEVAPYKRNPMDFVLWKPSTPEQPGWDSPWGRGRPGWHIECSAMAGTLFGPVFDIHGGGIDLQFPHHENEVAQSCCANGTDVMANVWMHNGFLQVEGEKMAKSLGNFFTVKDLRDQGMRSQVMRLMMLKTHYRQPLDWTSHGYDEARSELTRWSVRASAAKSEVGPTDELIEALADDLNTPAAISVIHRLTDKGNVSELLGAMKFLGIEPLKVAIINRGSKDSLAARIDALLAARSEAKKRKDYVVSDGIRGFLQAAGVVVEDGQDVPWRLGDDKVTLGWLALIPLAVEGNLSLSLDELRGLAGQYHVEFDERNGWSTSAGRLTVIPASELLDLAEKEFMS